MFIFVNCTNVAFASYIALVPHSAIRCLGRIMDTQPLIVWNVCNREQWIDALVVYGCLPHLTVRNIFLSSMGRGQIITCVPQGWETQDLHRALRLQTGEDRELIEYYMYEIHCKIPNRSTKIPHVFVNPAASGGSRLSDATELTMLEFWILLSQDMFTDMVQIQIRRSVFTDMVQVRRSVEVRLCSYQGYYGSFPIALFVESNL